MSRLDEIRERYRRVKQEIADDAHRVVFADKYRDDVGYLLSLLEVHPASEPPDSDRDVLVLTWHGFYAVDFCEKNGDWRHYGNKVKSWQELPE